METRLRSAPPLFQIRQGMFKHLLPAWRRLTVFTIQESMISVDLCIFSYLFLPIQRATRKIKWKLDLRSPWIKGQRWTKHYWTEGETFTAPSPFLLNFRDNWRTDHPIAPKFSMALLALLSPYSLTFRLDFSINLRVMIEFVALLQARFGRPIRIFLS